MIYRHLYLSGEAWALRPNATWMRLPGRDLPVSGSEVKLLGNSPTGVLYLITDDDIGWVFNAAWYNAGPFPGSPVALDEESWGSVKGGYR